MDSVDFTSPSGEFTQNVNGEIVLALMRTEDESFWNSRADTGFATLSIVRKQVEIARLVFTKINGYGFHMKFTECSNSSDLAWGYIASGNDDYNTVIEVNLCDSPIFLPKAYFIPLHLAEHVVQEVFESGSRTPKVMWLDERVLNWDIQEGKQCD